MLLHTTNTTVINTTMPQHLTSQYLRPLPQCDKLYYHHITIFLCYLCIYPRLRHSVTLIPSFRPVLFLSTLQLITVNQNRDSIPLLGSRSSKIIFQQPWLHRITLMKLPYCLQAIHKRCRFPGQRIIPSPPYMLL